MDMDGPENVGLLQFCWCLVQINNRGLLQLLVLMAGSVPKNLAK
jgi:hypothetical protein